MSEPEYRKLGRAEFVERMLDAQVERKVNARRLAADYKWESICRVFRRRVKQIKQGRKA